MFQILALCMFMGFMPLAAATQAPSATPAGTYVFAPVEEAWSVKVLGEDPRGITVELVINRLEILEEPDGHRLQVEGLPIRYSPGLPTWPGWSGVFAVPAETGLGVELLEQDERTLGGVRPRLAGPWHRDGLPEEPIGVPGPSGQPLQPALPAGCGVPALWHGVRVVPLDLDPFRWNPGTGELSVCTRLRVRLCYDGPDHRNPGRPGRMPSRLARQLVAPALANPGRLDQDQRLDPLEQHSLGRYLVIVPDAGLPYLQPLVDWKRQCGYSVTVLPLSTIGPQPTAAQIHQAIQQQYDGPGLDYLLLVGDFDATPQAYQLPANRVQGAEGNENTWGGDIVSDHGYSLLEGQDYFPEILVGRLSVDSHQQLAAVVSKLVAYERTPPAGVGGYDRALVVFDVAEAGSIRQTTLASREMLLEAGYSQVDTIRNDLYTNNLPPAVVTAAVNQGVGLVNYRGMGGYHQWVGPLFGVSHIQQGLTNFTCWPLVTSIVCGGGNFGSSSYDPCFGEAWLRASTGPDPRGAVAFIGPSDGNTHTMWNNAIDLGLYQGLAREGLRTFGALLGRGKLELWTQFPNHREEDWSIEAAGRCVPHYFHSYNLLGDPGMELRTRPPRHLVLQAPDRLPPGPRQLALRVTETPGGGPVSAARVCFLHPESGEACLGLTDAGGQALLDMGELAPGSCLLTVHGPDLYPVMQLVTVEDRDSALALLEVQAEGGENGCPRPGEEFSLRITLLEAGTTGSGETVTLRISGADSLLAVLDDQLDLVAPAPGDTLRTEGFRLRLDRTAHHGQRLRLDFLLGDSLQAHHALQVAGMDLRVAGPVVIQGAAEPGSSLVFRLELAATGALEVPQGTLVLDLSGGGGQVLQAEAPLPAMAPGDTLLVGPFEAGFAPGLPPGSVLGFGVEARTPGDSLLGRWPLSLTVGNPEPSDALGPGGGNYLMIDSRDSHPRAPTFDWVEIGTPSHALGLYDIPDVPYSQVIDGATALVELPFYFRFYGRSWNSITINSNGWAALGDRRNWISAHNTGLPAPQAPPGVIAVWWTDLISADGSADAEPFGDVHTAWDATTGLYRIQWTNLREAGSPDSLRFQLVLRDPAHWPDGGGEGELLLLYDRVGPGLGLNGVTVGIADYQARDGLQVVFNSRWAPACEPLADGVALLVTQAPPRDSLELDPRTLPGDFRLERIAPNPFNPSTRVEYSLGRPGRLEWSLFNLLGQRVAGGQFRQLQAGSHSFRLDGTGLASGVYLLRLEGQLEGGAGFQATRKIALVR